MSGVARKRILIVDDEEVIREFLSEVLGEDYDVSAARDGDEAIEVLGKERFDLVITDLKMPKVPGDQVVKFVHDQHPDVPVIVISGHSSLYTASQSASHGASGFLAKPFTIADLTKTVDETLGSHA